MFCVFMKTAFSILLLTELSDGSTILVREHFFYGNLSSWGAARHQCKQMGSILSTVKTEDDVERLINAAPANMIDPAWIGLKRMNASEPWMWSDRTALSFEKWANDLTFTHTGKACVYVRDGRWFVSRCGRDYAFYCSKTYNWMLTLVPKLMSWENALVYCRSEYTDLFSLLTRDTAEELINSAEVSGDFVWIGLRFLVGKWFWVNGESEAPRLTWQSKADTTCPVMPRRCAGLLVTTRHFEARSCEEKYNFICYSKERT